MKFHLGRARARVGVVQIPGAVLPRIPPFSRLGRNLVPVVFAVLNFADGVEGLGKEVSEIVVVGGILESEVADIGKIFGKLLGEAFAEVLDHGRLLLLTNLLVLLLVGSGLEALPGKASTEEVHEDMAQGLKIVTTRLLSAKMGIDTHVPSCTGKGLALAVGDVLLGLGVTVLLGHTKVDNVNNVRGLGLGAPN